MRIRSRSILLIISRTLQQFVSIIIAVILVRLLDKSTFGTYRQTLLVGVFLAGLLGLNIPASLFYFIPKTDTQKQKKMLTHLVFLILVMSVIAGFIMYFCSEMIADRFHNPELAELLRAASLYPLIAMLLQLIAPFMISVDRPIRSGVYSLLAAILQTASVVTLVALGYPLTVVIAGMLTVLSGLAMVAMFEMYRFSPGKFYFPIDKSLFYEIFIYILPLFTATGIALLNREFGKLVISSFFTADMFAVYSCGAIEIPFVSIVTGSVFNAIMPNLVVFGSARQFTEAWLLWKTATKKCTLVIYPVFVLLLVIAIDLIILVYGTDYKDATWPFMIYLLILPLRVTIYGAILKAVGETKPLAVAAAISLVSNIVICLVLVSAGNGTMLAFVGPSVALVVADMICILYLLTVISQTINVSFRSILPWKYMAFVLGVSLFAGSISFLVGNYIIDELVMKIVVKSVVFLFILSPLMWKLILENDEKNMITQQLKIIFRRK